MSTVPPLAVAALALCLGLAQPASAQPTPAGQTVTQAAGSPSMSVSVTDGSGRPLANAAVWLLPASGRLPPAPREIVSIEQRDREFVPLVTVVQTGTRVAFPNRDQMLHHVYSFSAAKRFELKLYEGDPPEPVLMDRTGVVSVGCNIHDWMQAFVLAVDTQHFAKTDAHGHASIRGLPPGSYDLRVWHPFQKAEASPRTVRVEGRSEARLAVDVYSPRRRHKPPHDPNAYGG